MESAIYETNLRCLPLLGRGKVRDIYAVDTNHLLIIASDRLSAFDVVFPEPIPGKGKILNDLSNFWFKKMQTLARNHLTQLRVSDVLSDSSECDLVGGRGVVVKRLTPVPIEAVVRGYIIGSGWEDYRKTGRTSGVHLEPGLSIAERLKRPIFTPSTKAELGTHDENIDFNQACNLVGLEIAEQIRSISIEIYSQAAEYALSKGIIIADTKMEFGLSNEGELVLIDELLTPDSSRFWPLDSYAVGSSPKSFDKQFVRDYLESIKWDKSPPAPKLPRSVVENTFSRYKAAHDLLMS